MKPLANSWNRRNAPVYEGPVPVVQLGVDARAFDMHSIFRKTGARRRSDLVVQIATQSRAA
jgi:hypothetical protein